MTFEEAKQRRNQLDADVARYSDVLNSYPKGPTGLTSDHVRSAREWQAAKAGYDRAFQELRSFNDKVFKAELAAERRARRGQVPNGNIPDENESRRLDDLSIYCSTLLDQLHGEDLDRVLAGEIKRRGLSDPEFRKRALDNAHPDDLVRALAENGITLGSFGISEVRREHMPNHAAVHYVWLVDYRGMPLDSEGPYGPMSLTRAEQFARIGATKGEHDRVVSIGREVMSDGFEILRRYRRGTGERVQ